MQTPKKCTATDISSDQSSSSCERASNQESLISNLDYVDTFHHHFKQTFLGPVCTKCKCKVAKGNILFDISRNSLKAHLTTNKCFSGNILLFKPRAVERSLRMSLIQYHTSMANNPALASRVVNNKFNFVSSSKNLPYCFKCGFVGTKLCNVKRHAKSNLNYCSDSDIRTADGTIMMNEYGFCISKSVLDQISRGIFVLPEKKLHVTNNASRILDNPPNTTPFSPQRTAMQLYPHFYENQTNIPPTQTNL